MSDTPRLSDAEVFYGSTQAISPASVPKAAPASEVATPPAPVEGARRDDASVLYGDPDALVASYEPAVKADLDRVAIELELSDVERADSMRDAAGLFNDLSLGSHEAAPLFGLYTQHLTQPPTAEQVKQWGEQSMSDMTSRYGHAELARRQVLIQKYVNSIDWLGPTLTETGLAWHPTVVATLFERADKLQPRGAAK